MIHPVKLVALLAIAGVSAEGAALPRQARSPTPWPREALTVPYSKEQPGCLLQLVRQDFERLERSRSVIKTPLTIGARRFEHGLGTHSVSHIRIHSSEPIRRFSAWVGLDNNERTRGYSGSVVFIVSAGGRELFRSPVMTVRDPAGRVDADAAGARTLELHVEDGGDGQICDHADWCEAAVALESGRSIRLDEMEQGVPNFGARYPFSFTYGGKSSDDLLETWRREDGAESVEGASRRRTTTWTDPATGLRLRWETVRYSDFAAAEWLLRFENSGAVDTPILENIQAMDLVLRSPMSGGPPYLLHRCKGGTPTPDMYEPAKLAIDPKNPRTLAAGNGRSSTQDFPFFKVDTGCGSAVVGIGWSGDWQAHFESPDGRNLRMSAGLERTHFLLHPGERVRSPRILVMYEPGDSLEANARFRQLIYAHYAAKRSGKGPEPMVFCNTCFTRGGGWLNECNARNQISLINAYAPLGLEALITDAGWFEGGWPAGAGNWNPRKDAYPQGMGPVAAAARKKGMVYGLWFEPERVVKGTWLEKNRPQWTLRSQAVPQDTLLLNFGLPQVQEYFFDIVKGFMGLPGFRFYRQDFNMDPLPYWRFNDPPDRQGITESKYVEGLYAFWERIAAAWPDSIREECASGGHRIDLETVMHMHAHQKSDYWFDDEVDQESLWAVSQYLPNNTIVAHLIRLDDYSFRSTLASSLCLGWIADANEFNAERGKKLLARYREIRRLLIGAWYPLIAPSQRRKDWIASQYDRPDLGQGMVLAFRRAGSPYPVAEVALRGLDAKATYLVRSDNTGRSQRTKGSGLMTRFEITLPAQHSSDLITYRRLKE